jgi:hypothetical protein
MAQFDHILSARVSIFPVGSRIAPGRSHARDCSSGYVRGPDFAVPSAGRVRRDQARGKRYRWQRRTSWRRWPRGWRRPDGRGRNGGLVGIARFGWFQWRRRNGRRHRRRRFRRLELPDAHRPGGSLHRARSSVPLHGVPSVCTLRLRCSPKRCSPSWTARLGAGHLHLRCQRHLVVRRQRMGLPRSPGVFARDLQRSRLHGARSLRRRNQQLSRRRPDPDVRHGGAAGADHLPVALGLPSA